jgi:hypothetical protein
VSFVAGIREIIPGNRTTERGIRSMGEIEAAPSAQEIRPLLVGSSIPVLTYTTPEGASFDFNAAVARRPTVLVCFRGGW